MVGWWSKASPSEAKKTEWQERCDWGRVSIIIRKDGLLAVDTYGTAATTIVLRV